MSLLLLLADPGTRPTRRAEPSARGPSSYPLDHEIPVERIILILEVPDKLWGREILTDFFFFFNPSPWRRSASNCWILGCWAVVLCTRPRRCCWQKNFGTSWWIMKSRNLNRKYSKSNPLPGVEKEQPFKNYTKFFGVHNTQNTKLLHILCTSDNY